jgi:hypothetical protein
MDVGVELLALGFELLDPVALEGLEEIALGQVDAVDEALEGSLGGAAGLIGHALDGAADVVGHVQHVAGEVRHCVGAGIGHLALRAASQVFHVGHQAQELVLQVRLLGLQHGDRVRRSLRGGLVGRGGGLGGVVWRGHVLVFRVVRLHRHSTEMGKGVGPHIRLQAAQIKRSGAGARRFPPG